MSNFGNAFLLGMQIGAKTAGQLTPLAANLKSGLEKQKLDAMANTFLNKMDPPRAEAVNPTDDLVAAMQGAGFSPQGTAPHAEGVDGLNMAMALRREERMSGSDDFNKSLALMREQRMQDSFDYGKQQDQQAKALRDQQAAQKAIDAASDKQREIFSDTNAYHRSMRVALGQLNQAKTDDEYESLMDEVNTLYDAATSRGLKVNLPNLPLKPSQIQANAELQSQIDDLEAQIEAKKGDWIPNGMQDIGGMEKQLSELKTKQGMPRSSPTSDFTPSQPQGNGGGVPTIKSQAEFDALPSGSEFIGPSGRRQRKQ